jgi:hypothetical protein
MIRACVVIGCILLAVQFSWAQHSRGNLDAMIASHAAANGVPPSLVRRVVMRESRYNARAVGRGGAMGLMQIKHATARGMGYRGSASGLLDANTNLTYAVRYLAGAYRAAGGNEARAIAYYQRGYHHAAKRQRIAVHRPRAERSYAQVTPGVRTWQAAATKSSRHRTAQRAQQRSASSFGWQSTQSASRPQHRATRATAPAAASPFNWQTAHVASPSRKRSLRYATAHTPSVLNWRAAKTMSAYRVRHNRRTAHAAPDLLQTLKKWFSPPRVRVAKLRRGVLR